MRAPTVLVVDDDAKFLSLLGRTLKRGGFSVLTTADGCDVPDLMASNRVDVIVLDLQMPGVNGWEVIRSLRRRAFSDPQTPPARPKIVVVSGRSEEDTVEFVRRLGADAYVTKPLWGDQILAAVRQVLSS